MVMGHGSFGKCFTLLFSEDDRERRNQGKVAGFFSGNG
jgi:hypothetical protein